MPPDLQIERDLNGIVCGIDEAGRGPLAGPVVAACVYIPQNTALLPFWQGINDSKKISAQKRSVLFDQIRMYGHYGIGLAEREEIDQINILQATYLAMRRAVDAMPLAPNHALIDGNGKPKDFPCPVTTVIKGDNLSLSIAAASILAKVTRDRIMNELHKKHPHYGWNRNAGYGTPQHLAAIQTHGITPHHRTSFAPIRRAGL